MVSLPILDIGAFVADPTSSTARAFVADLLAAAHGPGFVYLTGHGVAPRLDADLFVAAQQFFALPEDERRELAIVNSAAFRGYTVLGDERTNGKGDWRDQLDLGPEDVAPVLAEGDPSWLKLRGPNQWPTSLPGLRHATLAWMQAMDAVGLAALRALALGLGQTIDHFDAGFVPDSDVHLKIIRYPAVSASIGGTGEPGERGEPAETGGPGELGQGVGLHQDTGLLTFILQDDVGGLQVQLGDHMVDAPRVEGAYLMNLGEMLQTATDGYLRATPHRVISPAGGRERLSIAYFFNPRFELEFPPVELPPALAAEAPGADQVLADAALTTLFGENNLKTRLRSHPDVAARHYPEVVPT